MTLRDVLHTFATTVRKHMSCSKCFTSNSSIHFFLHFFNMYAKRKGLIDARIIFDGLPEKNVVTWTARISGYAHEEHGPGCP